MMKIVRWLVVSAALCLSACGGGGSVDLPLPAAQAQQRQPVFVVFGDSITVGYMPEGGIVQLRQDLSYTEDLKAMGPVFTYAAGGVTSDSGAGYQLLWMREVRADVVVVMFGINDSIYGLSPAQVIANARTMFEAFPGAKRILVSPPLWSDATREGQAAIAQAYKTEAFKLGATYLDFYTPSQNGEKWCHPVDHHPCASWHRELGAAIVAAAKGA